VDPPIVGVPITRTDKALGNAADAIDAGNGAQAVGPLTASRKYLLRSYNGAKYLIANAPPAPAEAGSANARKFVTLARRAIPASRSRAAVNGGWIKAQSSGAEGGAGPTFADAPTAVFDVFTSQFNAATATVGMAPDTKGQLLAKVKTTLNAAIVLRNRLVKIIHAASRPRRPRATAGSTPAQVVPRGWGDVRRRHARRDRAHRRRTAADAGRRQDSSVPSDSKAALTDAIAADKQMESLVNQWWPPASPGAD
jgi:hypothetical protein